MRRKTSLLLRRNRARRVAVGALACMLLLAVPTLAAASLTRGPGPSGTTTHPKPSPTPPPHGSAPPNPQISGGRDALRSYGDRVRVAFGHLGSEALIVSVGVAFAVALGALIAG